MKTYALLFSVGSYERGELEKLNAQELYDLASAASTVGYDEADVMTLDEFSTMANDEEINLVDCWLYFATV